MRKIDKIYADRNIVIYAPENVREIGNEADIAESCINAGFLMANEFAKHLIHPEIFWADFRKRIAEKELVAPES